MQATSLHELSKNFFDAVVFLSIVVTSRTLRMRVWDLGIEVLIIRRVEADGADHVSRLLTNPGIYNVILKCVLRYGDLSSASCLLTR